MAASSAQTRTIETQVPSRMDRLPWSSFHWRVVIGLGTVWILDGLEVTMVGSVAARLAEKGSGIALSPGQIGVAAAVYVTGACIGALFFGQLTDRFGRKKLFLITLLIYILATVATAFAFAPWYFYIARFFTGAGIGGEYAAINSAIDELIPARVRGQVDLVINGSYWLGAAIGALGAVLFLNTAIFPIDLGWRLAFGLGAVLGVGILVVRRHVPESPRWLFIHGREDEAEAIVDKIEQSVREDTGQELAEPEDTLKIRQRETIPFRMIARTAFQLYPKRAVLGLALFIGQAFIYNGITFNLGTLMSGFLGVASGTVPYFIAIYAVGNFLGPVLLGRLFDTVGRIPMIATTYIGSAVLTVPMALWFYTGSLNRWTFIGLIVIIFFLASAGASAAYLTVSEIFPMETRALAIAFFYAVGTAVGGISGPLLFGQMIGTGQVGYVVMAFLVGASVMAIGGIAEIFLGVRAEQSNLEDIAKPLTAEEADEEPSEGQEGVPREGHAHDAQSRRAEAELMRARAAEHRAASLELRPAADSGDAAAADRLQAEEILTEIAEVRANALEEQAVAHDFLHEAEAQEDGDASAAALTQAQAAEQRARAFSEQEQALTAEDPGAAGRHEELSAAASARARAREQRAQAARARSDDEAEPRVAEVRAAMHDKWADMHEQRAQLHVARAQGDARAQNDAEQQATVAEQEALAAEQRIIAAEHRAGSEDMRADLEQTDAQRADQEERRRRTEELERRIRERTTRRATREREGIRRLRPGPGQLLSSGRSGGLDPARAASVEKALEQEIDVVVRALQQNGPTDRHELVRLVGARYWGPGRFGAALRAAIEEGRVRRLSRQTYGPSEQ